MYRWFGVAGFVVALGVFASALSAASSVGFVNIDKVFNSSSYIKGANKTLQDDIATMNEKIAQQKTKLRQMIEVYHATKSDKEKKKLESPLKTEELVLRNLTDSFQKKIAQDKIAGKRQYDESLRVATEQVAKEKQLQAVVTNRCVLYSDKTWVDVTPDVERVLQNNFIKSQG